MQTGSHKNRYTFAVWVAASPDGGSLVYSWTVKVNESISFDNDGIEQVYLFMPKWTGKRIYS